MILAQPTQRKVFTSKEMPESVMDMDADGMLFAAHYLRDKIYSDKILAVVREYLANAIDEHRKFGISRPVEVTLPNSFSPDFKVRDFGMGLDDEGIRKIFGRYFKSTKMPVVTKLAVLESAARAHTHMPMHSMLSVSTRVCKELILALWRVLVIALLVRFCWSMNAQASSLAALKLLFL